MTFTFCFLQWELFPIKLKIDNSSQFFSGEIIGLGGQVEDHVGLLHTLTILLEHLESVPIMLYLQSKAHLFKIKRCLIFLILVSNIFLN